MDHMQEEEEAVIDAHREIIEVIYFQDFVN